MCSTYGINGGWWIIVLKVVASPSSNLQNIYLKRVCLPIASCCSYVHLA